MFVTSLLQNQSQFEDSHFVRCRLVDVARVQPSGAKSCHQFHGRLLRVYLNRLVESE